VNRRLTTASKPSDEGDDVEAARSDRDLVDRARAGDPEAFRALFERYHRRAFGLALGVVRNSDDALDVVQDAFIKAHRNLATFEGTSSFYTWLYRIVMNLAIDHIRRTRRVVNVAFDESPDRQLEAQAAAESEGLLPTKLDEHPGKTLIRKEMRAQMADALAGLSDNHRAVLVMREVEGLSYEEMAQAMKCSKGTIMSRLFHARKNMQRRLLELMGGEKDLEA
jgi:RNA polymerase sigma-70 factor (ECF subfamily)